jgi:pantoate--beta-alanine ligase
VEERKAATVLYRALRTASELVSAGVTSAAELRQAMVAVIASEPGAKIDYVAVVDPDTLEDIRDVVDGGLLGVAVIFGTTRLIDNLQLVPEKS